MTGTTTERLRTVGSSSSSLIMIHRHTARLIVYRSLTIPASQPTSQPANSPDDVDGIRACTIHMHLCTFLSARPFLNFFVISSSKGVSRDAFRFPPPRPRCLVYSSHIARNSWPHFVEHDRRFTFPVSALSSLPFSDSSLIRLVSRVAWNANERESLGSLARTRRILKKAAFPWNFHPSATLQRAVADFWLEPCPCNTLCNRGMTQARYDPD